MLTGTEFAQLTKILDDLPDVVLILNREGWILYANHPAAKILGAPRQEVVGKSWRDLRRSADVWEPLLDSVRSVFATGESLTFELTGTSSNVYQVTLSAFRPEGFVTAVVLLAHDITQIHDDLERTRLLQDVAVAATSSLGTEDMAAEVLSALERRMHLYKGDIRMLDESRERLMLLAHCGYPPETVRLINADARVLDSPFLTAEALRQRRILTYEDEVLTPKRIAQLQQAGVYQSRYMVAPLIARDEVVGSMSMTFEGRRSFSADELDLFSSVARIVAQGVSVSRSANLERRVSRSLQQAMIILPKRIEGVRFGHTYRAASEQAIIGGDFYHIFAIGDGVVGLFVGDISGKGIKVADLMIAAKNTLRAHLHEGFSPGEVLTLANAFLYQITGPDMFATAIVARLDTRSGDLSYANGGHPPALVRGEDGAVRELGTTGPLVGAFEDPTFETAGAHLDAGDVLVLYTDGIIETRGESGPLGQEGLVRILSAAPSDPVELVPAVLDEVTRAVGALTDDAAMLAVALADRP